MVRQIVIGVDEVGRGSLCSIVSCCAYTRTGKVIDGVCDSKKLSKNRRNKLVDEISENGLYKIKSLDEKVIDKINILNATMLCMRNSIFALIKKIRKDGNTTPIIVYVDGDKNPFNKSFGDFELPTSVLIQTIIGGDNKCYEISCASIIAKVYRDEIMEILHTHFPEYEWNKNMGYGTKKHIDAIKKYGASMIHRITFVKKFI